MDNKLLKTWEASYRSFSKSYDGTSFSKKGIFRVDIHIDILSQYYLHIVY